MNMAYPNLAISQSKLILTPVQFFKKYRRWVLIALSILIALELIALFWTNRPIQKTHSVITFKQGKIRILQKNDIVIGKGFPNSKVTLHLTPGTFKQDLAANDKGNWSFRMPNNFKDKRYRMTLEIFKGSSVESIKTYKVRVVSNVKIYNFTKSIKKIFNLS